MQNNIYKIVLLILLNFHCFGIFNKAYAYSNCYILSDSLQSRLDHVLDSISFEQERWFRCREWIEIDKVNFIPHDSIYLVADSIKNFNRDKVRTKDLLDFELYPLLLDPKYPCRSVCLKSTTDTQTYYERSGGFFPCYKVYQVLKNNDTIIIDSHQKLIQTFAPVNSIQKAFAFAYIFTGAKPIYNFVFLSNCPKDQNQHKNKEECLSSDNPNSHTYSKCPYSNHWISHLPQIESSYAIKVKDGYELLLYKYEYYGCDHPYLQIKIKVSTSGEVQILEKKRAFEDLHEYDFCAD